MALYISDTLKPSFSDKKMVFTDAIFDELKNKFQSEINTKLMEGKRYDSENNNWVDNKAQVENSLTSDNTEVALSAAKGKELKGLIDDLSDSALQSDDFDTTDYSNIGDMTADDFPKTTVASPNVVNKIVTAKLNEVIYDVLNTPI